MRIGFIGLGNMGEVMAARLLNDERLSLVVYDRNREAAKDLIRDGAVWAESLNQLANQCEIICSMLPGPTEMEEMTTGKMDYSNILSQGQYIYRPHYKFPRID